jgi:hypothetical protein
LSVPLNVFINGINIRKEFKNPVLNYYKQLFNIKRPWQTLPVFSKPNQKKFSNIFSNPRFEGLSEIFKNKPKN